MSWNSSIQFAKLLKAYTTLSTTALTNPMVANLNMSSYNINNVNTINAVAGNTLILHADSSQGIVVNTKMTIPNHPLVITNNTADDSLQVHDNISDTSIFRVDHNGNVGIKSTPSATLGHALVVNGGVNVTSHINVPTLPAGTNDTQVATSAFVQTAITSGIANAKTVRLASITTSVFNNGVSPIVLNNSTPSLPKTVLTITLPSAFTGCTSFTFYIRQISITTNTTFASGNTLFNLYPSQSLNTAINFNNGALTYRTFSAPNPITTANLDYVIWNWAPSGGLTSNTFYFNAESVENTSPASLTNILSLVITYDVVGEFTTLA